MRKYRFLPPPPHFSTVYEYVGTTNTALPWVLAYFSYIFAPWVDLCMGRGRAVARQRPECPGQGYRVCTSSIGRATSIRQALAGLKHYAKFVPLFVRTWSLVISFWNMRRMSSRIDEKRKVCEVSGRKNIKSRRMNGLAALAFVKRHARLALFYLRV